MGRLGVAVATIVPHCNATHHRRVEPKSPARTEEELDNLAPSEKQAPTRKCRQATAKFDVWHGPVLEMEGLSVSDQLGKVACTTVKYLAVCSTEANQQTHRAERCGSNMRVAC